jgi:tRNA1Val (adenine37-N6)-methyltransferase
VLLAASIPARPGDRVLELGTGAGAGLMCLAARVAGISGVGLERDGGQAALAAANFAANRFADLRAEQGDVGAFRADTPFDHALANPPWHNPLGTSSPVPGRASAKKAGADTLHEWVAVMAASLHPRGSLSLILPAASLAAGITALTHFDCAEIHILPFWPKPGVAAKILILRGFRQGRGACVMQAGLVLHEADGGFTDAAQAVLRSGRGL